MIVINIITSISALYVYTRCGKSIGWMLRPTNSKQTSVVVGYEWCDWLLNDNCFIVFVDATGLIKFKWWNIWSLTFLNISLVGKTLEIFHFSKYFILFIFHDWWYFVVCYLTAVINFSQPECTELYSLLGLATFWSPLINGQAVFGRCISIRLSVTDWLWKKY